MSKLQKVNSIQLDGQYDRSKTLNIMKEIFDSSNPNFTQISNPKTFQIKLNEKEFKIRKIAKMVDSSDPLYMALTQIRGVLNTEGNLSKITLFSEIHLVWVIFMMLGLITGVIISLIYSPELVLIIPSVLIQYFVLRYLANEDFKRFVPYFEEQIKGAKVIKKNI
ncbi:MAG: hypothetical protein ACJAT4_000263 [Granulosicoccus sp.]|jgi:hypothetical protein